MGTTAVSTPWRGADPHPTRGNALANLNSYADHHRAPPSLCLSERRGELASPAPKAFGQEGTARPGVEGSPKGGIKGVEIHTLVLVTALAKVVVLKGEHRFGQ